MWFFQNSPNGHSSVFASRRLRLVIDLLELESGRRLFAIGNDAASGIVTNGDITKPDLGPATSRR
jgi:hypothetical protein